MSQIMSSAFQSASSFEEAVALLNSMNFEVAEGSPDEIGVRGSVRGDVSSYEGAPSTDGARVYFV